MTNKRNDNINLLEEIFIKGQVYKNILSKKEVWKNIAEILNGKFTIKQTISRDITSFTLEIPYENKIIILTETDVKPLKSQIILELNNKFELNISKEDSIEKFMIFLGKQDIKIGFPEFDKKYLIQSNDSIKAINILTNLKELILNLNIYSISIQNTKEQYHKINITKDRNTNKTSEIIDFIKLNFKLIDSII